LILPGGVFALFAAFYKLVQEQWPEETLGETVFGLIPRWAKYLAGAALAYSFLDVVVYVLGQEGTQASIDGVYYFISNDKRTMHKISYEEYRVLCMQTLRMQTGGLLWFYVWLTNGYFFCLRSSGLSG
jgi:hypothetical protein